MRAVIQRVNHASVEVNKTIVGKIDCGLLVLLGIEHEDTNEDIDYLCGKIANLRIFNDENGIMNVSIKDINGEILVVSQFTLHASTKKGNRPSYIKAAHPNQAQPMYEQFVNQLQQELSKPIQTGVFGADMKVSLLNDGPVTIIIDSKNIM
jgi:D-tyrosyl-tRNA(Tyr) deacylase